MTDILCSNVIFPEIQNFLALLWRERIRGEGGHSDFALTLALSRGGRGKIISEFREYGSGLCRSYPYHKNMAALDRSRHGINQLPIRSRP
jgi:hypothetical protein